MCVAAPATRPRAVVSGRRGRRLLQRTWGVRCDSVLSRIPAGLVPGVGGAVPGRGRRAQPRAGKRPTRRSSRRTAGPCLSFISANGLLMPIRLSPGSVLSFLVPGRGYSTQALAVVSEPASSSSCSCTAGTSRSRPGARHRSRRPASRPGDVRRPARTVGGSIASAQSAPEGAPALYWPSKRGVVAADRAWTRRSAPAQSIRTLSLRLWSVRYKRAGDLDC